MDPNSLHIIQNPNTTIGSDPQSVFLNHSMSNEAQETNEMQSIQLSGNHASFIQNANHLQYSHLPVRKEVDEEGRICSVVLPQTPVNLSTEGNDAADLSTDLPAEENGLANLSTSIAAEENGIVNLPTNLSAEETAVEDLPTNHPAGDDISDHSSNPPVEENDDILMEQSQEEIKSENEDDSSSFMETAHDIFLQISSKEMNIQEASEILGRSYSFVYSKYQEFCDNITGKVAVKKKKRSKLKENGKKRGRPKKSSSSKRYREAFQCEDCPAIFHTAYLIKAHAKVHLKNNESHLCTSCGIVFSKLGQLMKHRLSDHNDALQCPYCDKQYTVIKTYQFHVNTHKKDEERPFVCEQCGKGFFSRVSLEAHYLKHSGLKPFMCGICEKSFKSLKVLTGHHHKHHTEEGTAPKACSVCGKTFISIKGLASHMKFHGGKYIEPKNHDCLECGRTFKTNFKLKQHMNTHTGAKPFACDLCDARFNQKANLLRHRMVHTGEKPFKCTYCPAAFSCKIDVKRHTMSHTGQKPFKCELCDYSCIKKHSLEYHMNTHTGKTPYKCDFYGCNAEFASPSTFKQHNRKHYPPSMKTCKLCSEKFPDLNSLKHHMLIHRGNKPLPCDQCDKIFYDQSSLNRHVYVHLNKPQGNKPKQSRQRKKNPRPKPAEKPELTDKKFGAYEVPTVTENGHNPSFNQVQSWSIPAQPTHTHQSFQSHFLPTQYTNMNVWSSASSIDPDEIRQRLLNSFK